MKSEIFVTVDVVVIFAGKVLLIKRNAIPFKGSWALPGGHVEENELLIDAAKRELFEETGVKIKKLKQFGIFDSPKREPRHRTISVAFYANVKSDNIKAGSDASEGKWFALNKLPKLAFDHSEMIELFKKTKKTNE